MDKGSRGQQEFLRNGWYTNHERNIIQQELSFLMPGTTPDNSLLHIQKEIQMVLEERGLWPTSGLRLSCEKQKCSNCQAITNCKLCVKGKRCKSCVKPKEHSDKCDRSCICDEYVRRKKRCQCMQKKYCT